MILVPKEKRAIVIAVIVITSVWLLTACAHMNVNNNIQALKTVRVGDTEQQMFKVMGRPDLRNNFGNIGFVVYYQTKTGTWSEGLIPPDLCTPIAVEAGRVAAIGNSQVNRWTRNTEIKLKKIRQAERKRKLAAMSAEARRKAEAERRRKIRALEKKVRPVPAHQAGLNLKLYRQLLELDPDNARYRKKVAVYEKRFAAQEKQKRKRAALAAEQRQRQQWEAKRNARNKRLRKYSGNGIAEMAVHDMGPGTLYVWIKNVSREVITTHPDHFTLLDDEKQVTRMEISASLDSVLEPGAISHGKIEYSDAIVPDKLIFRNPEAGLVSKSFR